MDLWTYETVNQWTYGPVCLWTYARVNLWACRTSAPVSLCTCKNVNLWTHGPVNLWTCEPSSNTYRTDWTVLESMNLLKLLVLFQNLWKYWTWWPLYWSYWFSFWTYDPMILFMNGPSEPDDPFFEHMNLLNLLSLQVCFLDLWADGTDWSSFWTYEHTEPIAPLSEPMNLVILFLNRCT